MAASSVAPLAPMLLYPRLYERGAGWETRTLGGGGALQVGDLRLLEDGSKRGGALVSDRILSETVSER
eukprot:scaffold41591_cov42-Phaeocystis_antarctica.AAC.2